MKTYNTPSPDQWPGLVQRPVMEASKIEGVVKNIIQEVKSRGDQALVDYARDFDKAELHAIKVTEKEFDEAERAIKEDLKRAISKASENISAFHDTQRPTTEKIATTPGVQCWRRSVAIEKVGIYVPGGTAPLFSTVLMLGIPAQLAGCSEIRLCTTPDSSGKINPAILYAARVSGITDVFKTGGAQAIAALAYGTESIAPVYKIFGPGNQYVTAAKQVVAQDGVAIDMPAGPSEVAVIADDTAHPAFVAADLLSQAEHGADSQVILITTCPDLPQKVEQELEKQLSLLPRKDTAWAALENSKIVVLPNLDDCISFSNSYAPEHLIIQVSDYGRTIDKITNAGSVFLGPYTPESAGDYAWGTNHTLPTNGYARAYSGLSLEAFMKNITFQEITETGIKNLGPTIETMAAAEYLEAHKNAVTVRLKYLENK